MHSVRIRLLAISAAALLCSGPSIKSGLGQNGPPPDRYTLIEPDQPWVSRTMRDMSLRDKIAQMVQIRINGKFLNRRDPDYQEIEQEITRNHVGGLVLFAGNVYESAVLINDLQQVSELPLIVSSDFERGASFRVAGTTSFPWTMAVGATGSEEFAYQEGAITAREARAMGVHWLFAPVMDVNDNPDNPVINIRSFGEDPRLVARLGTAFIRGARANGALTTAKHFPGHGNTETDTHLGLALIPADLAHLRTMELVPFESAISAGVDSIMTAHIAVPELTGEPEIPATLSPKILTDLLRETLNFDGLVVTDALEMAGITNRYWTGLAAVRAIQAGTDALLLPPDAGVAINEVERAVRNGEISEDRINRSVEKILSAKTRLGLHRARTVPLDEISRIVAAPESQELAQTMADRSITLLRNEGRAIPVNPLRPRKTFSLVLSSDLDNAPGSVFQAEMRRLFPSLKTMAADTRISQEVLTSIKKSVSEADLLIVSTIVRVVAGKGNIGIPENQQKILQQLMFSGKPVIWVAFGNPYVLRLFPGAKTYVCTFSYSDTSQIAAARALAGKITIEGKMPVSIPGYATLGDGIPISGLEMTLNRSLQADPAFEKTRQLLNSAAGTNNLLEPTLIVGHRNSIVFDYGSTQSYALQSLSEAVGILPEAMALADSGKLLLSAAVRDYLPEFQGSDKDRVTVLNLLTHSSGLPPTFSVKDVARYDQLLKKIASTPLEYAPGSKAIYSEANSVLVREIVARAAGKPPNTFVPDFLYSPLGMKSTRFQSAPVERIPTSLGASAGATDSTPLAIAGIEVSSTASDLAIYAQMLLNHGLYGSKRYFSPAVVDRFASPQKTGDGTRALGWEKPLKTNWTGSPFSSSAFGYSAPNGNALWIDPDKQLFIILLTRNSGESSRTIEAARQSIFESAITAVK